MRTGRPVLYGKFLSPYVRRVAVTLNLFEMPFEHKNISAIGDETEREAVNPVGRVPALCLVSGETLVDSAAILDHLDEIAGPERALIPPTGVERRKALQHLAIATGAIDRAMTANAERRRETPDADRLRRLLRQCQQGFAALEPSFSDQNISSLQQTHITAAVGFRFVNHIFPGTLTSDEFPSLSHLSLNCESHACFSAAPLDQVGRLNSG